MNPINHTYWAWLELQVTSMAYTGYVAYIGYVASKATMYTHHP